MMVPHLGTEQTRENLAPWGKWVEGLAVWGFPPLPRLLGLLGKVLPPTELF